MEITKGRFPHTTDIDGAVKVGSPLTLAIFVKDHVNVLIFVLKIVMVN